jgi:hypothetical protein
MTSDPFGQAASPDPFAQAAASAQVLAERTGQDRHDVAVVLGSGWAQAADTLGAGIQVALADLGGFPPPTVPGHVPAVRSVPTGPLRVLVFLGRTHLYEGYPVATVVHGVRTAIAAGCGVVEHPRCEPGRHVSDQRDRQHLGTEMACGDRFQGRGHADQVSAERAEHPDLGRGFIVRPWQRRVDAFGQVGVGVAGQPAQPP